MLRRRFCVLALCACSSAAISLLTGCQQRESAPEPTETLTIGYDEYHPFAFVDDNGNMAGIDVEIAQEACRRAGLRAEFKQVTWENRDQFLESGQVDCLWSCYSMNDREDSYAWVGPYLYSRQVVAVLNDSPIQSFADLAGTRVAVKTSTKPESIFLERAGVPAVKNVYCLSDVSEMAAALRNKFVDALAGHAATLAWYLQSTGVDYRFLDDELLRAALGVAFPQNSSTAVRSALGDALHQMSLDGTTAAIVQSYGLDPQKALSGVEHE